jgi:molybdate transport system substrate-binding protein
MATTTRCCTGLSHQIIWRWLASWCLLRRCLFGLVGALGCVVSATNAQTIAAASDLQPVLDSLIAQYNKANHTSVRVTYGSSGKLAAQIEAGAPFAVFLSADQKWTDGLRRRLVDAPMAIIAYGRLALVARKDSAVCRDGLDALTKETGKVALANTQHAPYGQAARAVLEARGVWSSLAERGRIVQAESVAHAAQWVASGVAPIGMVGWLSASALDAKRFCVQTVPMAPVAALPISALLVDPRARAVFDWLVSEPAREAFVRAGLFRG